MTGEPGTFCLLLLDHAQARRLPDSLGTFEARHTLERNDLLTAVGGGGA
jgi:hypothetical protein